MSFKIASSFFIFLTMKTWTTDGFAKVRPLFDAINKQCLAHYEPKQHLSVDESMVPYFASMILSNKSMENQLSLIKAMGAGKAVGVLCSITAIWWQGHTSGCMRRHRTGSRCSCCCTSTEMHTISTR